MSGNGNGNGGGQGGAGFNGFLDGLNTLFGRLSELAEKGEQLKNEGAFEQDGKEMRFQYGVSVRTAADGKTTVEPFGNVNRSNPRETTVEASVSEVREPLVDVIEEDDHVSIVAEMPGVAVDDVTVTVEDDVLVLEASKGDKRYRKEVVLPRGFDAAEPEVTANNGVVEIRLAD